MSDHTNISWTDCTWNPWRGCTKVSPGCKNCYASDLVNRFGGDFSKRVRAKDATFRSPIKWNKKPLVGNYCGKPFHPNEIGSDGGMCCPFCSTESDHEPSHRRRVFFGSLMDFLDPEVPVEWLADALDIVRRCEAMDFLMVTKRPELFAKRLRKVMDENWDENRLLSPFHNWLCDWQARDIPPKNVWIITSVEDQKRADERIPALLKIPAKVRGLSVEPLLESVGLNAALYPHGNGHPEGAPTINWGIVGGESGRNRRDCGVDAIVDVANQFKTANVPCFVKQDCALRPGQQGRIPDEIWNLKQFPSHAR